MQRFNGQACGNLLGKGERKASGDACNADEHTNAGQARLALDQT